MDVVRTAKDSHPRLVPKDAATLVLVDRQHSKPRILMGRRRADLAFMANKYVFPGGRVDVSDKTHPAASELTQATVARLLTAMKGRPSPLRARALAVAALRELHEETGLALGDPRRPPLAVLSLAARAITPPGRPRRYDTRFFLADAELLSPVKIEGDGELVELAWLTLEEAGRLDLPNITRTIIGDLAVRLQPRRDPFEAEIPFYYVRSGIQHRDLL